MHKTCSVLTSVRMRAFLIALDSLQRRQFVGIKYIGNVGLKEHIIIK